MQSSAPIAPTDNPSTTLFLNETPNKGRDSDIYLSVSNAEEMYSIGELGNIVRPFNYKPIAGAAVNMNNQVDAANHCEDRDAFFRTYRLYDHGDPAGAASTKRHDDLFDWFYTSNDDGSYSGIRVNPLSDIPRVLQAAVQNVPLDYWLVDEITTRLAADNTVPSSLSDKNYSEMLSGTSWERFTNGWANCLINARNNSTINTDLSRNIRDEYCTHTYFGWYSEASNLDRALTPSSAPSVPGLSFPLSLTKDLYGVDRKMLYSYTLESFSDRQQLFLFLLNAEATAASFGERARSLAGGRAIALVWRDPYPHRDDPASAPDPVPANMFYDLISPWHQYYVGADDASYMKIDSDPDGLNRDNRFYDYQILYFKYLDR